MVLPLFLLCGCFEVKEDFVLEADGSGSIRIETKVAVPPELMQNMNMGGENGALIYPPVSEQEAKRFFPGNDFTLKIDEQEQEAGARKIIVVDVKFKDINALLKSPYGRARALALEKTNGTMTFKAITAMEAAAAHMSMAQDDMFKEWGGAFGIKVPELRKAAEKMRSEFRVTLPGVISAGNGTREGKTISWNFQRAKAKDAADFAQQLSTVLQASFPAEDVKFSPRQIPRPALQTFSELQETVLVDKGDSPDEKKIAAAAKFVPCSLQLTRSVDLSGDGGSEANQAVLAGMLVVPQTMAPQKWGEVKLEEVLDSNGHSLQLGQNRFPMQMAFPAMGMESDSTISVSQASSKGPAQEQRTINIRFQTPDWQSREILRLKGSVGLTYFGGIHLLKLTNAVLASSLKEVTPGSGMDFNEGPAKALSHPKLGELGLTLLLEGAMRMGVASMLGVKTEGKHSTVQEVQAYDKDGKPWPTYLNLEGVGQDTFQVIVVGPVEAPLSLAMFVNGGGTTVQVPIVLEHIPTSGPVKEANP